MVICVGIWQMSEEPSDACLEPCLQKRVTKGSCEYFSASSKRLSQQDPVMRELE